MPKQAILSLPRPDLPDPRPAVQPPTMRQAIPARYALQPGLELIPQGAGGVLLSRRPLLAMRLNQQAYNLLSRLVIECSIAELAGRQLDLAPKEIELFLDSLVRRRLVLRKPPVSNQWPAVSIIVPARGRPEATRACVQSLLALDYPAELREIIVVDDASEPPLAPYLADLPVKLLRQERNIGQSAARNLAAAAARGSLLAFTDNDCLADPAWLRTLVPYFDCPLTGVVGGRVVAPLEKGLIAAFEAVRSPLDMGPSGGEVGPGQRVAYLPSCNLLVRRDLLLAQKGFDAAMRLGEDVDFIWRSLGSGARAWYVPDGKIVHYHRVRLGTLLGRRADYGSSEADLQRRYPQGRRVMPVPGVGGLALGMLVALPAFFPAGIALGGLILTLFGWELAAKRRQLRRLGIGLSLPGISAALLREHGAALYHLSANVSRYYSLPLLGACFWPGLLPAIAVLLLLAPVVDYRRLRPGIGLTAFIALYGLEMAAYQIGVWLGCWRQATLRPLLPRLSLRH